MRLQPAVVPFVLAALIGTSAAISSQALAQDGGLPPEANNPAVRAAAAACAPDIRSFCAGVVPGGGRIVRCLVGNEEKLSAVCKENILRAKSALGR